jgi:hypothetical protein
MNMFNWKFWKMVRWIIKMKQKHGIYCFVLLCSSTEIILYINEPKGVDDEFRISIL